MFYEIKRNRSRIDLAKLEEKSAAFFEKNPQLKSREASFAGLSMEEM